MQIPLRIKRNAIYKNTKRIIPTFVKESIFGDSSGKKKIRDLRLSVEKGKKLIPQHITIELANSCNAECTFCTQPTQMTREKGVMSDELFEILLDNIKTYNIGDVMLGGIGEPFLNKNIISRIDSLKKLGVHVTVTTNGSLFNGKINQDIIASGVDKISVSMDAIDDGYLKRVKPGIKKTVTEIEESIKNLYELRNEIGAESPFILLRYQMTEDSNNMDNKDEEKKCILSREKIICDKVEIRKQHDWSGELNDIHNKKQLSTPENVCNYLCRQVNLTWNGNVSFCCMDYDDKVVLGNLFNDDIVDIFNSEKIIEARKMYLDGTINQHILCSGCYS